MIHTQHNWPSAGNTIQVQTGNLAHWWNGRIKAFGWFFKEGHCWRIGNHKCSPSGSNITWLWLRSCLMVGAQVAAKIITEFSESTKNISNTRDQQCQATKCTKRTFDWPQMHWLTTNAVQSRQDWRHFCQIGGFPVWQLHQPRTDVGVGAEVNIESQQNIEEHQLGKNDAKGQELQWSNGRINRPQVHTKAGLKLTICLVHCTRYSVNLVGTVSIWLMQYQCGLDAVSMCVVGMYSWYKEIGKLRQN